MLRAAERTQMKDGKRVTAFCPESSLSSTPVTSHHEGDISLRSNDEAESSFEFCPIRSGFGPNPVTFS